MVHFPYEIFSLIAFFLPDDLRILYQLIGLHRAFLHRYLALRYRELELSIYAPDILMVLQQLINYVNPSYVIKYVRVLKLNASAPPRRRPWARETPRAHYVVPTVPLLATLQKLLFVKEVHFIFDEHLYSAVPETLQELIQTIWSMVMTFPLQRLHLQGNISCLSLILPNNHTFPDSFKSLSICFSDFFDDKPCEGALHRVISFISGFRLQLKSLFLECPDDSTGCWDIIEGLGQFPLLAHFGVDLYAEYRLTGHGSDKNVHVARLQDFLSRNSAGLSALQLNVYIPDEDYAIFEIFSTMWLSNHITFAGITSLDIAPQNFGLHFNAMFPFIISLCPLEHLTIRGGPLFEVYNFVRVASLLRSCHTLASLSLHLGGNIFDEMLYTLLSRISSVREVSINWIHDDPQMYYAEIVAFIWSVERLRFSDWELHDLRLFCNDEHMDLYIVQAIAKTIPRLRTLWGLRKSDEGPLKFKHVFDFFEVLTTEQKQFAEQKHHCRGCALRGTDATFRHMAFCRRRA